MIIIVVLAIGIAGKGMPPESLDISEIDQDINTKFHQTKIRYKESGIRKNNILKISSLALDLSLKSL